MPKIFKFDLIPLNLNGSTSQRQMDGEVGGYRAEGKWTDAYTQRGRKEGLSQRVRERNRERERPDVRNHGPASQGTYCYQV